MSDTFKALLLTQNTAGKTVAEIRQLSNADLPEGDVLVAVDYSSLNYKDGLAVTGKGKIVRTWPMRGTLHFVAAADVRWMLELLAGRVMAGNAARLQRQFDLDEAERRAHIFSSGNNET